MFYDLLSSYDDDRTPSMTLTFWFKRVDGEDEKEEMTIFSNGIVEVSSQLSGGVHTINLSVVLVNHVGYHVEGEVKLASYN